MVAIVQTDLCHDEKVPVLNPKILLNGITSRSSIISPPISKPFFKFWSLPPTVSFNEVDLVFREPYVLNGYRIPHQSFSYYIKSLFQLQNELMNVWTHVLAFVVSVMLLVYRYIPQLGSFDDPHTWPFLIGYSTSLSLYLFSVIAHSCHSKNQWCHYNFFMLDYCGVGLYGLGTGTHHYYYSGEDWFLDCVTHVYLPVLTALSLFTCWGSSYFKVTCDRPYPIIRRVAQCGSVAVMYIWIVMPLFSRFYHCFTGPDHIACDQSLTMHSKQLFWFLLAGFFFSTHMPHRLSPGRFDIFMHGHQLFHLCILMTSLYANEAVFMDFKLKSVSISKRSPNSLLACISPVIIVVFGEFLLLRWLRGILRKKLNLE